MKLYKNEEVVKALKEILAKDYPYLEYDAEGSEHRSNPPAEKQFEHQRILIFYA